MATARSSSPDTARSAPFLLIGGAWFAAAILLSATGRIAALQPPSPQILLFGLTGAVLFAAFRIAPARRWVESLPTRGLVALHLTRLVAGSAFLIDYTRGQLPGTFAIPSGWGDIVVAVFARILLAKTRVVDARTRGLYIAWNLLGLVDILFVVANAARTANADPRSMQALLQLPLSLLPTFLVPLIIASHVIIAVRLARLKATGPAA